MTLTLDARSNTSVPLFCVEIDLAGKKGGKIDVMMGLKKLGGGLGMFLKDGDKSASS